MAYQLLAFKGDSSKKIKKVREVTGQMFVIAKDSYNLIFNRKTTDNKRRLSC